MLLPEGDGNTPLQPEEQAELIPELSTQQELNEWERQNILEARPWALEARNLSDDVLLTEDHVRELHRRMFGQTWRWAGAYRMTERNLGIPHLQIRESIAILMGDTRYRLEDKTCAIDEIATIFHHRLVQIHPFANGNGRHARLFADALLVAHGQAPFIWGSAELTNAGDVRTRYIAALRAADRHDLTALLRFVRS